MPDRVHHHPNLIYSPGTQVVALVEVLGQSGKVLHPRGSVGVVVRLPVDSEHSYRVRFADGIEASLRRDQVTMLGRYKESEIGTLLANCEPTTHRLVRKVVQPPPYRRDDCRWEPTLLSPVGDGTGPRSPSPPSLRSAQGRPWPCGEVQVCPGISA